MQIKLYKTISERNAMVKKLTNELAVNGVLREQASILAPVFQLSTVQNTAQYNYAFIEAFNRYYYISDIVSVKNGLWEISLSVDPLMSWADQIKETTAIALRNDQIFNLYLPDPQFSNDARSLIQYREIGKFDGFTTIITVMGGDPNG